MTQLNRSHLWSLTALAVTSVMILLSTSITSGKPVSATQLKEADEQTAEAVKEHLQELEDNRQQLGKDDWAKAMQQLILLDRPAAPLLIKELDATNDHYRIRCIVFALRGIGDKSAIPALIRAIPKTLQPPMSDYGLRCDDPDLMKFMKEHDTDSDDRDLHYSFGRPISEVSRTLKQWTEQDLGYSEIIFVQRAGGPHQQSQQERLYMAVAIRFADWWREHWQEYVDDPALSVINLPTPRRSQAALGIPTGPRVEQSGGFSSMLASVLEKDHDLPAGFPEDWAPPTFTDLDTGRNFRWPDTLPPPDQIAGHEAEVAAWAARNGIDLMGTHYRPPGSDDTYSVLQPFALRAWQISDEELTNILGTLRSDSLKLGPPTDGYLCHYDAQTGRFRPEQPCSFLFVTREGTCGTIRVVSQVTQRANVDKPVAWGAGVTVTFLFARPDGASYPAKTQ